MANGMHELFELSEGGARALRRAGAVAAACVLIGASAALFSDLSDRFLSSTPSFALAQMWREASGQRSEREREAQALLNFSVAQTGLTRLGWLRMGLANDLGSAGAQARFNLASFRVSLGEELDEQGPWAQRWVSLHEIGHAAARSTLRSAPYPLPSFGLSPGARESMESSLVYQQAYGESFADVFALAMALRLDPRDPEAAARVRGAIGGGVKSISLAHDTSWALKIASVKLPELSASQGPALMGALDAIASEGALRTVSAWGAEREALCAAGAWGWVSWARTEGHMVASNPWKMASESPPAQGEPMAVELLELMAFRGSQGSLTRRAVEGEREDYARAARALGEPAQKNTGLAMAGAASPVAGSWGEALARNEWKSANAARESFEPLALSVARAFGPSRPYGCPYG